MKKIFITILAAGIALAAGAQSKITNQSVNKDGKDAIVTFDIETAENSIPSNRKEVIMPYLYNAKDTVWLETIEIFGKNRYKREKQENYLAGDKDWELEDGQMIKGYKLLFTI